MKTITGLLLIIALLGCGDTGCTYERYIQIIRDPLTGTVKYWDCVEETCPGLPHRKTCQ